MEIQLGGIDIGIGKVAYQSQKYGLSLQGPQVLGYAGINIKEGQAGLYGRVSSSSLNGYFKIADCVKVSIDMYYMTTGGGVILGKRGIKAGTSFLNILGADISITF